MHLMEKAGVKFMPVVPCSPKVHDLSTPWVSGDGKFKLTSAERPSSPGAGVSLSELALQSLIEEADVGVSARICGCVHV